MTGRRHEQPDYLTAEAVYRQCRSQGETVRQLTDCLIAAVAMRHGLSVLHHDVDFDVIARHTTLDTHRPKRR